MQKHKMYIYIECVCGIRIHSAKPISDHIHVCVQRTHGNALLWRRTDVASFRIVIDVTHNIHKLIHLHVAQHLLPSLKSTVWTRTNECKIYSIFQLTTVATTLLKNTRFNMHMNKTLVFFIFSLVGLLVYIHTKYTQKHTHMSAIWNQSVENNKQIKL